MFVNSNYSDEQLLQWIQNDVEDAFYALYEKYHRAIYLNIIRLIKSNQEAEDILQEVFCRLWQKRHTLQADHSIGGWLFKVSYHLAIDYLRNTLKRHKAIEQFCETDDQEISTGVIEMQWTVMEEAIQKLSLQKRKVFTLCKLEGKSYENAADELGLTKNTVSGYLKEAIAFIRLYVQRSPLTLLEISGISLYLFIY